MPNTSKPIKSQTLLRGLDMIEAVAQAPMSIPDIAEATGVTYPTAHRIISALIARNYLKQIDNRTFGLGPKIVELGFMAYQQADVIKIARPFLMDLALATSDTVHLARIDDGEVIYLDKLHSRRPIQISSRIGGRKPAISTGVGKALLLYETEDEWHRLYQRDHHLTRTKISEQAWIEMMSNYRTGGYAYDLGEDEQQIRCVAAPLHDGRGDVVAAISVSSTLSYMSMERMESLIPVVTQTAAVISRELGFSRA